MPRRVSVQVTAIDEGAETTVVWVNEGVRDIMDFGRWVLGRDQVTGLRHRYHSMTNTRVRVKSLVGLARRRLAPQTRSLNRESIQHDELLSHNVTLRVVIHLEMSVNVMAKNATNDAASTQNFILQFCRGGVEFTKARE